MIIFNIFVALIGAAAASDVDASRRDRREFDYTPTCPSYTPVFWKIELACGPFFFPMNMDTSLAHKVDVINEMLSTDGCDVFEPKIYLQQNVNHEKKRREADSAPHRNERSGEVPLTVLLVIDMDVSDDAYWATTMPNQIKAHLDNVNFPVGTTFEIILAGPDNIFVHYPLSTPEEDSTDTYTHDVSSSVFTYSGKRKRRSHDDVPMNLACEIKDKNILMTRLLAAIASTPAMPKSLYSAAGLSRPGHIRWISEYLHKFLPLSGNVLAMHVVNHNARVNHADIEEYHTFLRLMEQSRPGLQVMHHYMFAGTSAPMAARLVELGVTQSANAKWSIGLNNVAVTIQVLLTVGGSGVTVVTDPVVSTGMSCKSNPCQNGCTCQQSCRDENDYVCVPPAGRPFVGKNCEWEAVVQCTADRSIRVSIPTAAVSQYAMGVNNVVVQGCNNAPSYICNDNPSCAPVMHPTGGFYVLECTSNSFTTSNGQWTFGQTIIFDRASSLVSMPHPIVKVECLMQTRPATSVIRPELRGPQSLTQTIFWQPVFGFYKTKWDAPMILANNGNQLPNGAVGYIIGERIHVRITATLNGVPSVTLPNKHAITVTSCTITPGGVATGTPIQIISAGAAVSGTPFPVSVDHDPGNLGGGATPSSEGVGFSFQVFTFGPGSTLQLTCTVNINSARRRRSADNMTDLDTETVIADLLVFAKAEEELNDIPTLAMQQDQIVEVVYMESTTPQGRAAEIEELNMAINELPAWFFGLLVTLVVLTLTFSITVYKRRYAKKNEFEDVKVRLFN